MAAIDHKTLRARNQTVTTKLMLAFHKISPSNPQAVSIMLDYGWADDLGAVYEVPFGPEKFDAFVNYLFSQNEDTANLTLITNRLGRKAREQFMSIAEKLRTEGRAEGEVLGAAKTLTALLTHKFGPLPVASGYAIQSADQTQLETWTIHVLSAQTLDEVFH